MKLPSIIFNLWVCLIFSLDVSMADIDLASNRSPPPSLRFFLVSPPPHFPPLPPPLDEARFHPGVVIIVSVLATLVGIVFLLLLYARYYKLGIAEVNGQSNSSDLARKNSGINRSVVESLPMFRFATLRGHKDGLECAVCLNAFESNQVLRLLPKCRHAFHMECVDTWLDAHSTCPLCRCRVDPEDVLLIQNENMQGGEEEAAELTRRVSGRHSSAGEKKSTIVVQIVVERPIEDESTQWRRKSVDSAISSGVRNDGVLITEREKRRRFEHRIVWEGGAQRRWSDLRPSDVLNVQRRMMMGCSKKSLSVNSTSVSDVTGLSRFASNGRAREGPIRSSSSVE